MKTLPVLTLLAAIFLLFAFPTYSNAQYAQLQGYILWPDNRPVSGATVSIGAYAVSTDQYGHYFFDFLNLGQHAISISPPGKPTRSFFVTAGPGSTQRDFKVDW